MNLLKSSLISIILHTIVIGSFIIFGLIHGCNKKKEPEIVPFTVAIDLPQEDAQEEEEKEKIIPPTPPAPKDDIIVNKPQPPPPKKDPPKPKPKEKKPFVKGKRTTKTINEPPPKKVTTQKPLTQDQIKKLLAQGAVIGDTTSIPADELSRNYAIIRNAIYEAWQVPPPAECGRKLAIVTFTISPNGKISTPRITQSSGSPTFDNSILSAIRTTSSIRNLTPSFLRTTQTITIEFTPE